MHKKRKLQIQKREHSNFRIANKMQLGQEFEESASDAYHSTRRAPPKHNDRAYRHQSAKKCPSRRLEKDVPRPAPEKGSSIRKDYCPQICYEPASKPGSPSSAPPPLRPPTTHSAVEHVRGVGSSNRARGSQATELSPIGHRLSSIDTAPNHASEPVVFKTSDTRISSETTKTQLGLRESPIYKNGELIELPQIPTE